MIDSERYQIKYEIGRGAMGVVYCALDTLMDREVALKVLSPAPGLNERDVEVAT